VTTVGTDCDADLVEQVTLNDLEPAAAFRWRVDWIDGFAYPKRREHLGASIALMKISRNDLDFIDKMDAHDPLWILCSNIGNRACRTGMRILESDR
jgi:hypothetical protein